MTEEFTVSANQWAALELVVRRAQGNQATYVVTTPVGDAAISRRTAEALERRGFITASASAAWPTEGGRTALQHHLRRNRAR